MTKPDFHGRTTFSLRAKEGRVLVTIHDQVLDQCFGPFIDEPALRRAFYEHIAVLMAAAAAKYEKAPQVICVLLEASDFGPRQAH